MRSMVEFVVVDKADDLEEGGMRVFGIRGSSVAVAYVDGAFHAFNDTCTHMRCSLAKGDLVKTTVICPCHGYEFDVRSGAVLQGPTWEPVETYEVRVEGDNLEIKG
jgi:nitrite reductase/ring-hydroxylating ferredoxin subunit